MKKKNIIKCLLIAIGISIILYITVTTISIWNYSKLDEKKLTDVVIVLGAGTSNGEVSPVFQERINHGIWLYQNGYSDKLIFTGSIGDGNKESDAYVAKQYAINRGIPKESILIEEESNITQENIENAKLIMNEHSYHTAIIVSDPLHMKRAMLMANDYEIEAYSSPTPTTKYISLKSKLPFLAREEFFYIGYRIYRNFQ